MAFLHSYMEVAFKMTLLTWAEIKIQGFPG